MFVASYIAQWSRAQVKNPGFNSWWLLAFHFPVIHFKTLFELLSLVHRFCMEHMVVMLD